MNEIAPMIFWWMTHWHHNEARQILKAKTKVEEAGIDIYEIQYA